MLDLKDYGPGNNRDYGYNLLVIDNFSEIGWTVPLKNKNAQTVTNFFENILIIPKRKPNLIVIKTEDGSKFVNNLFTNLLNEINIKR